MLGNPVSVQQRCVALAFDINPRTKENKKSGSNTGATPNQNKSQLKQ
jgi:hypothetical protein